MGVAPRPRHAGSNANQISSQGHQIAVQTLTLQLTSNQSATIPSQPSGALGRSSADPPIRVWDSMQRYLLYALDPGVARRSFVVALIVGTVLNIINQGDTIFAGEAVSWGKAALTFAVPYCVATYGAVSYRIRLEKHSGNQ